MIFPEEQAVLTKLLAEWYKTIKEFTEGANKIFSERGKRLDSHSPPWMRHNFPEGYSHEIGKKIGRVKQLLQGGPSGQDAPLGKMVYGSEVLDELRDICNYSRMMGAVIMMLNRRLIAGAFDVADVDVPDDKAREAIEEFDRTAKALGKWRRDAP